MVGAIIGWLFGAVISLAIVYSIPGDQSILAFIIGFIFGMLGFSIGRYIDERIRWNR